jgi:hypothetical protein
MPGELESLLLRADSSRNAMMFQRSSLGSASLVFNEAIILSNRSGDRTPSGISKFRTLKLNGQAKRPVLSRIIRASGVLSLKPSL